VTSLICEKSFYFKFYFMHIPYLRRVDRSAMPEIQPILWHEDHLVLLDQRLLPQRQEWLNVQNYSGAIEAIRQMSVRGAPAIGVTAAYAMALASREAQVASFNEFMAVLRSMGTEIAAARPTAVNLSWAVDRCIATAEGCSTPGEAREQLLEEAHAIREADLAANQAMGAFGAVLLPSEGGVLTHCNTGALATSGWGTALGVIRTAWAQGKRFHVFCTETRPWLQGARLTSWELVELGIPASLIVDSAAGTLMRQGEVDAVVVGADRIASNGDSANKIGTYTLAVLAKEHGVPFYVAAPSSTIDFSTASGDDMQIEERAPEEVTHLQGHPLAAEGIGVRNPAFDVTPNSYISAIITEYGVIQPPLAENLGAAPWRHGPEVVA
jgi:methylthioribose-1-phosphate isomerase